MRQEDSEHPSPLPPGVETTVLPIVAIPDGRDIVAWWNAHPLSRRVRIASPIRIVAVQSGDDLQRIVNEAPDYTRIQLSPGRYQYPHVVGKNGIYFLGVPGVVFELRQTAFIGPSSFAFEYHTGLTRSVARGDSAARTLVTTGRTRSIYFSNIVIDHVDGAGDISIAACNGIMWDRCSFVNGKYGGDFHLGHVNGNACLDNIYFRNCEFAGGFRHPIYLDGVHGSVIINCHVTGQYASSGFLFLCNNDFTHDYDNDGEIGPSEQRMSRFVVMVGVRSEVFLTSLIEVTGGPLLVEHCDASVTDLVYQARKAHQRAVYDQRGVVIRNNTIRDARSALTVDRLVDTTAGYAATLVGEYSVTGNTMDRLDTP